MTITITPCESCEAPIFFALSTKTGKIMPVDADPIPQGNLLIRERDGKPPTVTVMPGAQVSVFDQDDDGTRYVTHFVTCPNAEEWRKHGRPISKEKLATPGPKRWRTMHR